MAKRTGGQGLLDEAEAQAREAMLYLKAKIGTPQKALHHLGLGWLSFGHGLALGVADAEATRAFDLLTVAERKLAERLS